MPKHERFEAYERGVLRRLGYSKRKIEEATKWDGEKYPGLAVQGDFKIWQAALAPVEEAFKRAKAEYENEVSAYDSLGMNNCLFALLEELGKIVGDETTNGEAN